MRADAGPIPDQPAFYDPLTGGLETKRPPHRLTPSYSPDLDNVVLSRDTVQRRGGFRQLIHQQPRLSTMKNRGHHARSRASNAAGSVDTDFLIVPGCLVAGHREFWDDADVRDGIVLDFWFCPSDLTTEHGGNGEPTGSTHGPAPYDLRVRPILSKGPVKRTANTALSAPGGIGWSTTSRWGPAGNTQHAMPFCVFLYDDAADGNFSIAFGFHYKDAGALWQRALLVVDPGPNNRVEVGTCYHILAGYSVSSREVVLRVGWGHETGSPTYENATLTLPAGSTPIPQATPTPIQVFDCPQEWIEANTGGSATRPPGLGLNTAADGGYYFACKRAEGDIEDVTIYRGYSDITSGVYDRAGKHRLDRDNAPATILQAWPGEGPTLDIVKEESGKENHLYRVPDGPITDLLSGSASLGSWFFNGQTAYAMAELTNENVANGGNPNWRAGITPTDLGTLQWCLMNDEPHGVEVAFWPDAVEPNFQQVVMEIHSVIRVAIDIDGSIVAYCRDGNLTPLYDPPARSTTIVEPGCRYHVVAIRDDTSLLLYVNGILEDTQVVTGINPASTYDVSGLTFGMGAITFTSNNQDDDSINTDTRSGFCGRIEHGAVLVGSRAEATIYRVPKDDDYEIKQSRLWSFPQSSGTPTLVSPRDMEIPTANIDSVANVGAGHAIHAGGIVVDNVKVSLPISDSGSTPTRYVLGEPVPAPGIGGANNLVQVAAFTMRAIGLWVMNLLEDDLPYAGSYDPEVEVHFDGASNVPCFAKSVWLQRSLVTDQLGYLNRLQRRCCESDLMSDTLQGAIQMDAREYSHRLRPYWFRSPRELQPTSGYGFLRPLLGENPISMVKDWQTEEANERFLIAACRRSVLWVKGARKILDSPIEGEFRTNPLWFFGQRNDYCRAEGLTAFDAGNNWATTAFAAVEFWCFPQRLDGQRLVLISGDDAANVRYGVFLEDGAVNVFGTMDPAGFWYWSEGKYTATTYTPHVKVESQVWNHVYIEIGNNAVTVRVNGILVPMVDRGTELIADPINNNDVPSVTRLWLGGIDETQENPIMVSQIFGGHQFNWQNWCGFLMEVHDNVVPQSLWWPAASNGRRPKDRVIADGNTRFLFHAAEDEGWRVENTVGPDAKVNIQELVPIKTDLRDTGYTPYSSVVYRNEMVLTNGIDFPHVIGFESYTEDNPFNMRRLGIEAPGIGNGAPRIAFEVAGTVWLTTESYSVYVSFFGSDGTESEPDLQAIATPGSNSDILHIFNLPRSSNPDVVARGIYVSISGASPLLMKVIQDNESRDAEIRFIPPLAPSFVAGSRLPAPRARKIEVGQGVIVLAGLIGVNQNSFAVSGTDKGYFPISRFVVVDSKDGKPVLGVSANIGNIYIHKRDAVYAYRMGSFGNGDGLSSASVDLVNDSNGCAGGTSTYDNVTFGANTRGVWRFDGSNMVYASRSLEGVFQDLELRDEAVAAMQGAYYWRDSQYWLSTRLLGEQWNTLAYVLHTTVSDGQAWTKCSMPPHVAMASVVDPNNQQPLLAIGTIHGSILVLDEDNDIDVVRDVDHWRGPHLLSLSTAVKTATSITVVGPLDDSYDGYRGCPIVFYGTDGERVDEVERFVVSNTDTVVNWDQPASLPVGAIAVIGAYKAYWTSGWQTFPIKGSGIRWEFIDLEFEPSTGTLRIDNTSSVKSPTQREWYPVDQESRDISMALGFLERPRKVNLRTMARYHRVRFRADGVRTPFKISGWGWRGGAFGTVGGDHG